VSKLDSAELCTSGLTNSVIHVHSARFFVKLAIQAFDLAFCIGELLPETFYLLLLLSVPVAEEKKLIGYIYRYKK
jgi:hypothetical protein